jgi:hypothetical protein
MTAESKPGQLQRLQRLVAVSGSGDSESDEDLQGEIKPVPGFFLMKHTLFLFAPDFSALL